MSSSIDPIRRAARLRRATRTEAGRAEAGRAEAASSAPDADAADRPGLPVVVDGPQTVPPRAETAASGAMFDAHLLGQDGQKRGLRAGPTAIDSASASYNRIEWSGAHDRRARKGHIAKTEI
jgi:hypothetical protein